MSLLQALKLPTPASLGGSTAPAASPATAATKPTTATMKPASPASPAKAGKLGDAAAAWRDTHRQADERIKALQAAVKAHCADSPAALRAEIEKGLARLDAVLDAVDHRLADALDKAGGAKDEAARQAELAMAKALCAEYIGFVRGDPLVAHIDQNPFGVKTGLAALLGAGLGAAAKAI
jgi:hypothetical protein